MFTTCSIYDSSTNAPNLPIITALSALAIVQGESDLLSAAVSELLKLPSDQRAAQDPSGDVAYLLRCEARLRGDTEGLRTVLAKAAFVDPSSSRGRAALRELCDPSSQGEGEGSWEKRMFQAPHAALPGGTR